MAIRDYKSSAAYPSRDKKPAGKAATFRALIAGIGMGFLLGVAASSGVYVVYLGGDTDENTPTTLSATETPSAAPAQPAPAAPPENYNDYQFYEVLKNSELSPVGQDAANSLPPAGQETPSEQQAHIPPQQNDRVPAADRAPSNGYVLQVGTFTERANAHTRRRRVFDLGYKEVQLHQYTQNNKRYYRVWLGPYESRATAQSIQRTLRAAQIEVLLSSQLEAFRAR